MAENFTKRINELKRLEDNLPEDGSFRDCDTILADILDEANHEVTGISVEVFDNYIESEDKDKIMALFEALTGVTFEDYLSKCEFIIKKELTDSNPKERLMKKGFSEREAEEIIMAYDEDVKIFNVYGSVTDVGRLLCRGIAEPSTKAMTEMAKILIKDRDDYLELSSGRVVKVNND